jgi:hypothetical protein
MGYTMAQTGQMLDTMGGVTNTGTDLQQRFTQGTGFARFTGMDPTAALRLQGQAGLYQGRDVDRYELMDVLGTAQGKGMGEGRLQEFMETSVNLQRQMLTTTGESGLGTVLGLQRNVSRVFGTEGGMAELGKGQFGADFAGRLQGVMTQSGPMKTYMMRAMGFGTDPDLSYVEMRKRQEAGIFDSRNLKSLFGSLQERGLGESGMFRAIESVAGGQLKAFEIEAMVKAFGNEEGLRALEGEEFSGKRVTRNKLMAQLRETDPQAAEMLASGDSDVWKKIGQRHIAQGEHQDVQLEGMQYTAGKPIAQVMMDMTDMFQSLGGMLRNVLGTDIGGFLTGISGAMKEMAAVGDRLTTGIDQANTAAGAVARGMDNYSKAIAVTNVYGAQSGLTYVGATAVRNNAWMWSGGHYNPSFSDLGVTDPGALAAERMQQGGTDD